MLYAISQGSPMTCTVYQNPESTHTLKIGKTSLKRDLRGFSLACWQERFLYITGGFSKGESESAKVHEYDIFNRIKPHELPAMNEARTSHSSCIEGQDYLAVFCGFSFRNGPLNSIEVIDLQAIESSRGLSVTWTKLGVTAHTPCWSPMFFIRLQCPNNTDDFG